MDLQPTRPGMTCLRQACSRVLLAWTDAAHEPSGSARTAMGLFLMADRCLTRHRINEGLVHLDRAYKILDLSGYTASPVWPTGAPPQNRENKP